MAQHYLLGHHLSYSRNFAETTFKQAREYENTICAIFLKGQFALSSKDLTDKQIDSFKKHRGDIDVYPHACYSMNFLSDEPSKQVSALSSLKNEAKLCETLDIDNVNIHPGYTSAHDKAHYAQLAEAIRKTNEEYESVRVIVENMTGGTKGCSSMDQMRLLNECMEDAGNLKYGFCLDTCHLWAAGYDVRNCMDSVVDMFDEAVGLNKLSLMHFNGSKADIGSGIDRHANLMSEECLITGCFCDDDQYNDPNHVCQCGEDFLSVMMNRMRDIPKIFEPPKKIDTDGIKVPDLQPLIPRLLTRVVR